MDRSWVELNRMSDSYKTGLNNFIGIAVERTAVNGHILCPCRICCNRYRRLPPMVYQHMVIQGMDRRYMTGSWVSHGDEFRAGGSNDPSNMNQARGTFAQTLLTDVFRDEFMAWVDEDVASPLHRSPTDGNFVFFVKAIAATNKKNRRNLKLKHTVGTKSYAVIKENYKAIHGHYPDPLTFYEMAHKNANGTYIKEDAAAHMATMQEKLAAMPEEVRETPEAREKIFHEHFKEKNGHGTVFQEGHGVTPNEVHSTASSSFSLSRRISNAQMEQERLEQMMAEWREQMAKEREEQLVREQAEKAIEREALKNELRQELRTEFQMASRQEYQQMYGIPWQSMPPDMSFTQSLVGADTQLPMHGFLPTLRPSPSYGVFPPFNTNVPYNFSGNERTNDQEEDA